MAMEIDKKILQASIDALDAEGLYAENLKEIMAEANLLEAGNIPHKIILTDEGYLQTKIIKEKVVLQ